MIAALIPGTFYVDLMGTEVEVRAVALPVCIVCNDEQIFTPQEFEARGFVKVDP